MYLYKNTYKYEKKFTEGIKLSILDWIHSFKYDKRFRRVFFFSFYTGLILFRTILCRPIWVNPLNNIIGVWGLYDIDGDLYTENIENTMLFIPFIYLFLQIKSGKDIWKVKDIIIKSVKMSFALSVIIEMSQLFLKVGTLQFTDLVFNTIGGMVGGILFWLIKINSSGKMKK